jgi:hypothetical protein
VAYLVNGVDLTTFATRITTGDGLQDGADPDDGAVKLYGFDGAYDPYLTGGRRPADGAGSITFDMWLVGVDATTGLISTSSTMDLYYRQWDALVRLFHRRRLTIDHVGPVGTRRCFARLASGMSPARDPSSPWFGRFKAVCVIPAAHWFDTSTVTTGTVAVANGGALDLSVFTGATAPITDVKVRFGAGNNPRLTSPTGAFVAWNGVIAATRQVEFQSATGLITSGTGTAWTPGYTAGSYAYSPGPRFFEVDPTEALTATLTHTGVGTVSVEVLGTRRYRTSGGG